MRIKSDAIKLRDSRFGAYVIDVRVLHLYSSKPISIEDHLMTAVSLTHLVSLCCRQCPTASVDQHRWAKLPRDTFACSHANLLPALICRTLPSLINSSIQQCVPILFAKRILPSGYEQSLLFSTERTYMSDRPWEGAGKSQTFM